MMKSVPVPFSSSGQGSSPSFLLVLTFNLKPHTPAKASGNFWVFLRRNVKKKHDFPVHSDRVFKV